MSWCVLTAKWLCSIPRCSDRRKCCFSKVPSYFSSRSFLPRMWGSSNRVKGTLEARLSGLCPGSERESTNDISSCVTLSKNLSLSEPQVDRLLPLVCATHSVVSDSLWPHSPPGSSVHGDSPGKNTKLPFPSPGDLPDPGIKSRSPALKADSLPFEPPEKPLTT